MQVWNGLILKHWTVHLFICQRTHLPYTNIHPEVTLHSWRDVKVQELAVHLTHVRTDNKLNDMIVGPAVSMAVPVSERPDMIQLTQYQYAQPTAATVVSIRMSSHHSPHPVSVRSVSWRDSPDLVLVSWHDSSDPMSECPDMIHQTQCQSVLTWFSRPNVRVSWHDSADPMSVSWHD